MYNKIDCPVHSVDREGHKRKTRKFDRKVHLKRFVDKIRLKEEENGEIIKVKENKVDNMFIFVHFAGRLI